jgi:hypothetical protein
VTVQHVNAACPQRPWRSSFPLGDDRFAGAAQVVVDPFPRGLNNWHATPALAADRAGGIYWQSERSREPAKDRCAANGEDVVDGFLDHDHIQWLTGSAARRAAMSCAEARADGLALPLLSRTGGMRDAGREVTGADSAGLSGVPHGRACPAG